MVQLPTNTILARRAFSALVFAGLLLALCSGPALADTTFTVKNTKNGGPGSLRSAIQKANTAPGEDMIRFNISGSLGSIVPTSSLPEITEAVTIDGYTQPGASENTLEQGNNAVLKIRINGANAGRHANGLKIEAGGNTIRGLVINRFKMSGILVASNDNHIEGNYLGTDQTGTLDHANGRAGVQVMGGSNNIIGGSDDPEGQRNLVSHNRRGGVLIKGSSIGNRVLSNMIYDNRGPGIDLGDDGVTANDDDDPDAGPNNLQNFPEIASATKSGGTTTITGTLNSTPDQTFTVQCFLTGGDAASDHGEGRTLLGQDTVTTGTDGDIGFSCDSSAPEVGQTVSATATSMTTGDTSEFAANRTVE